MAIVAPVTEPSPRAERRRAPRAQADFSIQFSSSPNAAPAVARDVSEIGLACLSPTEIPEMTIVGIDFTLPDSKIRHHVVGAVVRCERDHRSGKFDLAVYFTEVPEPTKKSLRGFVRTAPAAP